jgi:transcriptional regulator with XRE-family HTH domain
MKMTIKNADDLGKRIRELREDQGRKQSEVAELIGISQGQYSKIERGIHSPSFNKLVEICDYLGVTPNDLLDYQPNPTEVDKVVALYDEFLETSDFLYREGGFRWAEAMGRSIARTDFRKNMGDKLEGVVLSDSEINEFLYRISESPGESRYTGLFLTNLVKNARASGNNHLEIRSRVPVSELVIPVDNGNIWISSLDVQVTLAYRERMPEE